MMTRFSISIAVASFLCISSALALSLQQQSKASTLPSSLDRRSALSVMASTLLLSAPTTLLAMEMNGDQQRLEARSELLRLIEAAADDASILSAIDKLVPLDPSHGRVMDADLDGAWKLLWSYKAEAFSPLLQLPPPLKPSSFQYLGSAAASEVGSGRVAQGLTGGILGPKQFWLSSGIVESPDDPSIRVIRPPFRFQLGERYPLASEKLTLVEAGSDAEFRQVNARTKEAQQAPSNQYKQLYVENGKEGSLRISTITSGDPVIVGAVFCHMKL